jgi:hypothetical protein
MIRVFIFKCLLNKYTVQLIAAPHYPFRPPANPHPLPFQVSFLLSSPSPRLTVDQYFVRFNLLSATCPLWVDACFFQDEKQLPTSWRLPTCENGSLILDSQPWIYERASVIFSHVTLDVYVRIKNFKTKSYINGFGFLFILYVIFRLVVVVVVICQYLYMLSKIQENNFCSENFLDSMYMESMTSKKNLTKYWSNKPTRI